MGRRRFDAFVSYSTDPDRNIAIALQDGLRNLYNPWYRPGPYMRVFRDATSMAPGGGLAQKIYRGLDRSEHLVVLLSPQATDPVGYVNDEIHYWRQNSGERKQHADDLSIIPVVTVWGNAASGELLPSLSAFQWSGDDVPGSLHGVFEVDDKPLGVDMRWAHQPGADLTLANPDFYKNVAAIAAAIKGIDLEAFDKDLRSLRMRARTLIGTIALGACILLAAIGLSLVAYFRAQSAADAERANAATAAAEAKAAAAETEAARAQLQTVNDELEAKAGELETAAADLDAARGELATALNDVAAADAEVDAANARVDAARAEVDAATAAALEANGRVDLANARLDAANADLADANAGLATAVDERDAAEAARAAAQGEVDALAVQLDSLQNQVTAAKAAVAEAAAALVAAEQNLAATQQELVTTQQSLETTQSLEEAADLAVQAAAAGAGGDAALGVILAVESVLTVDPPSASSYRALINARETLAVSTWQQVGVPVRVGAAASTAALSESLTSEPADEVCSHDSVTRRPLRFIRGAALTSDGRQLLINTPNAIRSIDTVTRQQRTVVESATEICGFDVDADGTTLTMVEGTAGDAALSAVDIVTGARQWSTPMVEMIRPARVEIGADGRIAVEGWWRATATDDPVLTVQVWDPATLDPVNSWSGRLAGYDDQLITYEGGDSTPAGYFDYSSVSGSIFDGNLEMIDFYNWYSGGWGRATVVADPTGGSLLIVDDRGQIHREQLAVVESTTNDIVNGLSNPFVVDHTTDRAYLGSLDGVIAIVDLTTLAVEQEFKLSDVEIESLALDTSVGRLWAVDGAGTVTSISLDPARGELVKEIGVGSSNFDTPFIGLTMDATPNGARVLISGRPYKYTTPVYDRWCDVVDSQSPNPWTAVFDAATGEYWTVSHPVFDPERRPGVNDRYLVSFAPAVCFLQITDLRTRNNRFVEFASGTTVQAVAVAADVDRIIVATDDALWSLNAAAANSEPVLLRTGVPGVLAIDISDNGDLIAVRDGAGVSVRSGIDGRLLHAEVGGPAWRNPTEFALSHDGHLLALSANGVVEVRDLATGAVLARLDASAATGEGIDFSRDGRFLSAGGGSLVWALNGWERIAVRLPRTSLQDGVFVRDATLVTFGRSPSGNADEHVWITDVLDLESACSASATFLDGRSSEIDEILRGERTRRGCVTGAS